MTSTPQVNQSTFIMVTVRLAVDEPDRAWGELREAMSRWSQRGFHIQRHNELIATTLVHLYGGIGSAAWSFLHGKERLYRQSLIWRIQQCRIDFLQLRARAALTAVANQASYPKPLLRSAERDARKLSRESAEWGQALGALMYACVQDARCGGCDATLFAAAAARLEAADLGVFAAAARYRQGERTSGPAGERLRQSATEWLTGQGVRKPLKIIRSHAPIGRPEPTE